jgi:hypothetical protein
VLRWSSQPVGGAVEVQGGVARRAHRRRAAVFRPQEALITESDIEDAWTQVKPSTARSWRDSLLVGDVDAAQFLTGKADAEDCRRLTDALFDETLLGRASGSSALTGFDRGGRLAAAPPGRRLRREEPRRLDAVAEGPAADLRPLHADR